MIAIETTNLTKRFQERTAVDSLSLSIEEGDIFALLGANGAGKTTTIKILSGLLLPTSGDAVLMGNSVVQDPEKVKRIINVSPQETAVAPRLTVEENIDLIAKIYGSDKREAAAKTQQMLGDFSLTGRAKDKVGSLSGGMQRKLSIALALISDPQILFLDEPTIGLVVRARRELWNLLSGLKGTMTIVLTTHYLEEAEALADRIGIMYDGHMRAIGTSEEIKQLTGASNLEEAFLMLTEEVYR